MKPGKKMMVVDRMRQGEQSRNEYGGNQNRRMIGFDRDPQRERTTQNMPHIPPMSAYGYGGEMNYGEYRGEYRGEGRGENRSEYRNEGRGEYRGENRGGQEYGRYNEMPESRRRRDRRGRYAMGGEYDEDEEEEKYSPRSMRGNYRPRSNSYGDIYAEGTIYAPNAMNRPMSGMMGAMMGGEMSEPVDEHTARMWVQKMDGGEHFKPEMAEQYRTALCPQCEKWEYFVAINAMYSDYCETAKKMGTDKPEFYAYLAKDFLMDKDAGPHKLRKYMMTIPKQ